jgi:hypothetical protein
MRHTTIALCLSALTAASGCAFFEANPFPTTGFATVEEACAARQIPGASSPAFCQCLDKEARYAADGDARTYQRLVAMTIGQVDTNGMTKREEQVFSNVRDDWRVMLQNSGLRCAPHAPGVEPFFGFDY